MAKTPESRVRHEGPDHVIRATDKITPENGSEDLNRVRRGEFTQHQIADPFSTMGVGRFSDAWAVIAPPMNLNSLLRMASDNSVLKQCIDAMVTNVSGHGYRLEYIGPEGQMESPAAEHEANFINAFMQHPNGDYSFTELRKRVRWDLECLGNGYMEVARDKAGRVTAMWHIPGHLVRITEMDKSDTPVDVALPRMGGTIIKKINKSFRRFVQVRGTKTVYFKEFDDPRSIDPTTGAENKSLPYEDTATEVIHMSLYHAGHAYGLPRWTNNIVALQGSRQAELTNLDYFGDNAVPAMVVMVSGGTLSRQSMTQLENTFTALRGRASQNRVVFLEAYGDERAVAENGVIPPPRIEIKPLSEGRPKDGQFLEYDKAQTTKIRSSFRLPPLLIGLSEEYSHATAGASYSVAEGQVFGPERVLEDDIINFKIMANYNLLYWNVRSNPPRISDPAQVLSAMTTLEGVGAMTPNTAIGVANELFDLDIEHIAEAWASFPFSVVQEMAKTAPLIGWEGVAGKPITPEVPLPGATKPAPKPDPEDEEVTKEEVHARVIRSALADLRALLPTRKHDEAAAINQGVRVRAAPVPLMEVETEAKTASLING